MNNGLYAAMAVIALTVACFSVVSIWSRRFGTQAVEKWAMARGWQLIHASRRAIFPLWGSLWKSERFQFFPVTVRDMGGTNYEAWLRLESDCTESEVLDVIWDGKTPSS